jgi:hypothetical protein
VKSSCINAVAANLFREENKLSAQARSSKGASASCWH